MVKLLSDFFPEFKKINIDPAGKVEFWYQDSFDVDRGERRPEFAGISMYVVFYNVNDDPVMVMIETQTDFIWHNPRPGFQKIENKNNKMIPEFLNTIDMYPGPVLKIYKCCG